MKLPFSLLTLGLLALALRTPVQAESLQPGDLIAICGDSITEQKRYSLFMADYFLLCQPAPDLQAMQFGWGGEVAGGFLSRMKNDTLAFKPTVATTCYGMNDGGYREKQDGVIANYRKNLESIVKNFRDGGVRFIVLGSPGVVDSDFFKRPTATPEVYNDTLAALAQAAKEVAQQQGVAYADVNGVMMDAMKQAKAKYGTGYDVAGRDGVHPGSNGHVAMAYAFLKALGCSGDIGTYTLDLKSGEARATGGHKILSSAGGTVEIESTQYPFCFTGDPKDPQSTAGIIEFIPFNQELNRLTLIVKNASADKLKVTWGGESKEFTAEQLAKGVNLAAEFLKNPFSEPFAKAEAVILKQQNFETPAIKGMINGMPRWQDSLPGKSESIQQLRKNIEDLSLAFREQSRAAVVPVKHQIKVEPVTAS